MALTPFLSALLQAGQILLRVSPKAKDRLPSSDLEVLKCTETMVLSESGCAEVSDDAGQKGWSLTALATLGFADDGVRDGTQNEGREGCADCEYPCQLRSSIYRA